MSEPRGGESTQGLFALLLTTLIAFGVAIVSYATGLSAPVDRAFADFCTRAALEAVRSDLVIIEIDAHSLHELGSWPWPRSRHAALIDTLRRLGAERIFLDIDFSTPSRPTEDAKLAEAISRAPNLVVLPQFWQPLSIDSKPLLLSEPLAEIRLHARLGSVNLVPDVDGLVREVPDLNATDATSAPPVWRTLTGAGPRSSLVLNYRLSPLSYKKYSYSDLLQGISAPDLRGKTLMVGATAIEMGDIVPVPVYRSLPGVLVQATAYESGLRPPLRHAPAPVVIALLGLGALLFTYILSRGSWWTLPWIAAGCAGATLFLTNFIYQYGNVIPAPSPFLALVLCSFVGVALSMLYTETWRSWRASRKLRQQDTLLRQIVDRSADALFTLDPSGRVSTANDATALLLRRETSSLPGLPLHLLAPQLAVLLGSVSPEKELQREFVELNLNDGTKAPIEISARHMAWEDSSVIAVTLHDVSVQRRREEDLRYRATHDGLTGLPNRLKLMELLTAELPRASVEQPLRLLMLDLDGFKEVNDTLGHDMGDALLVELGRRFSDLMAQCTCIARLGGDEFAILISEETPRDLESFCAQVRSTVSAPIVAKGVPLSVGASIGIAIAPMHGIEPTQLLQCADLALYAAKRAHTDVEMFNPAMDVRSPRRLQMLTLLRSAIQRDELHLVFQPKVSLQTRETREVEVLCRWNSPSLGSVSPVEFIPLAEASDLIRPLTEWTMAQALACCKIWHAQALSVKVAVNLSARHLQDEHLPEWLGDLLTRSGVGAEFLEIEITEGAIMRDPDRALRILQAIRALGITLSIDDYGTGYSSLSYLQKLSVDRLKIDKSFVAGLLTNDRDHLIVKSTIDLAHALNLEVIAEGIETVHQAAILRRLGCDYAQGYLYSRPLQFDKVAGWFRERFESDGKERVANG